MSSSDLSAGVVAFVGFDRDASVPGRFPARIADPALRERVLAVFRDVDADADPSQAVRLSEWGDDLAARAHSRYPELSEDALKAIKALLTFEYR